MRNVWVLFPSADMERARECSDKWAAKGYQVAGQTDVAAQAFPAHLIVSCEYNGYWDAINRLYRAIGDRGDVFVAIGDDMDPDPNHSAQEIADIYSSRFPNDDGIMQPCGDPQGSIIDGKANAARICGSPWWGHGWANELWMKHPEWGGPMPAQFWHFYGDEFLKLYAEKKELLWMNSDLTQWHHHWSFAGKARTDYQEKNQGHWKKDQDHFREMCGIYGLEP